MYISSSSIKCIGLITMLATWVACTDEPLSSATSDTMNHSLDKEMIDKGQDDIGLILDISIQRTLDQYSTINMITPLDTGLGFDVGIDFMINLDLGIDLELDFDMGLENDIGGHNADMSEVIATELDATIPFISDIGPNDLPYMTSWEPLDLSEVDAYRIPRSAKIFARLHPDYDTIPNTVTIAVSNVMIRVPISVYLIDSTIWTESSQLLPYFELVNDYFHQARIQLVFTFRQGQAPLWEANIDQLHIYFTNAMMNPSGAIPDGFGNLPAGKAVLNDRLMNRSHVHANPLFLPGKPIGHEIGHVLGLPHVTPRTFLMAQGTSVSNQLDLTPDEAVIMRIMALHRFGGESIE